MGGVLREPPSGRPGWLGELLPHQPWPLLVPSWPIVWLRGKSHGCRVSQSWGFAPLLVEFTEGQVGPQMFLALQLGAEPLGVGFVPVVGAFQDGDTVSEVEDGKHRYEQAKQQEG